MTKNSKENSNNNDNVSLIFIKLKTSFQELQHACLNKLNIENNIYDKQNLLLQILTAAFKSLRLVNRQYNLIFL